MLGVGHKSALPLYGYANLLAQSPSDSLHLFQINVQIANERVQNDTCTDGSRKSKSVDPLA